MARTARTARRSRRTVPLRTSKGTRRVALPRPKTSKLADRESSPKPLDLLTESLEDRWKKFSRLLRDGIPTGNRKKIDVSVHDMRTAARRLLAAVAALEPVVDTKATHRLTRRVDSILDRLGPLRDLGVQMDTLPTVGLNASGPALRRLRTQLERDHEQRARKLRKRLRRENASRLKDDIRRLMKRSCRVNGSLKASAIQRAALQSSRDAFARLHESRLAVNPTELQTIHRMRIALKEFRYLMEASSLDPRSERA